MSEEAMVNVTLEKANETHFGNYFKQQDSNYFLTDIIHDAGR